MSDSITAAMSRILEVTTDLPKEKINELVQTIDQSQQQGLASTLEQVLIDEEILDEKSARELRRDAEAVMDAPKIAGYVIVSKLGQGGMGAVYKAVQTSMDRLVALKILPAERAKDSAFVDRFYREARTSGKLDHVNVVRGYDVGESGGLHFFAMEFVDGQSVEKTLAEQKKFQIADAVRIVYDVACALLHAQELNLVHRDIKPDNIMVTRKGVVKLADLGLAKLIDESSSLTQTGSGFGTPFYMPPEQARNAKYVDARSDIYALGVTLYRMVTGKLPYAGDTAMEILTAKEKATYPKASSVNSHVPAPLNLLIDKMMAKDPAHRYQSAAELVADLDRLGLHGAHLSWIDPALVATVARTVAHSGSRSDLVAATEPIQSAKRKVAAKKAKSKEPPAGEPEVWFIKYRDESGKEVKVRLETPRVRELIKSDQLDERAEAARSPKGPFRKLATYSEFDRLLQGRIAQKRAEKRAPHTSHRLSDLIQNIDKEERWYKWKRKLQDMGHVTTSWILAAVVVSVGGYFIWDYVSKNWDAKSPTTGQSPTGANASSS